MITNAQNVDMRVSNMNNTLHFSIYVYLNSDTSLNERTTAGMAKDG